MKIVYTEEGRALADRAALAQLTGRSVHTIRARCSIVRHWGPQRLALYDVDECAAVLAGVPSRNR